MGSVANVGGTSAITYPSVGMKSRKKYRELQTSGVSTPITSKNARFDQGADASAPGRDGHVTPCVGPVVIQTFGEGVLLVPYAAHHLHNKKECKDGDQ